jgi:MoxR-like ATPase
MNEAWYWSAVQRAIEEGVAHRIYLSGPPGVGKSFTAIKFIEQRGLKPYQLTLSEDYSLQECLGHYLPKGNVFEWHHGPVALAMMHGGLVVNELPRASGAVKDLFLAVLDNQESCRIALPNGEEIRPHPHFVCIATGNLSPEAAGLDEALRDRFDSMIEIRAPHPELIALINEKLPGLGDLVSRSYSSDPAHARVEPRSAMSYVELRRVFDMQGAAVLAFGADKADHFMSALALLK